METILCGANHQTACFNFDYSSNIVEIGKKDYIPDIKMDSLINALTTILQVDAPWFIILNFG